MRHPTTLAALLRELAERDPAAVVAIDAGVSDPVTVSRHDLHRRSEQLREDLRQRGVGQGDCVAVWLPNWSDTLVWQFAVAALGAHVIGVNTRYNVDELTHVLDRARPIVIAVAHDFHGLDLLGTLRTATARTTTSAPSVAVVAGPYRTAPAETDRYDLGAGAWIPSPPDTPPTTSAESGGHDLAVAFTTSGSTGKPKLAAHTESAVVGHACDDAAGMDVRTGDAVLCVLPLSGVFGFNTAMAALAGGAVCVLEPVFDDVTVVDDMARHGVTHVVGADDMLVRLQDAWRARPRDLSSWRWAGMADFLGRSHEIAEWARDEFGTRTTGVYGSSEVFALTLFWPPDEPEPRRWNGGGRPVSAATEVRAVDPVTEDAVAVGEQGELQLRGPTVVDAYLGDPQAAARSFTTDGWFRTGDFAVVSADGAVDYRGRIGDALRLRGFLVDPAEIEHRLVEHDAVHTAKVVGIDGPDGATLAVGYVVPVDECEVDPGELRDWCGGTLARFKVPSEIHVIPSMPTTSGTNGSKIHAATLREWARARHTPEHSTEGRR
ncbi:AMP-binding protein [Allosaccharopolyspora coralli]|uniref:Long-chain-fatty-acid--CoA ligase n=1 Tax=Allosaccharopolyspora coralli TaxID=2665642 RepID=A0A5Q3QCP5_9PSEU|nr:AMP-binding protein [Allosaccharopolyspora coralli]QGK71004.1 AMP-binding protein [Allosaccharopolyspora coralli]